MMLKQKSESGGKWKYLFILPLTALSIAAFAQTGNSGKKNELPVPEVNNLTLFSNKNFVNKKIRTTDNDLVLIENVGQNGREFEMRIRLSKPPLIIVDGREVGFEQFLYDPPRTTNVKILDASMATELYGNKAKYGAWIFFEKVKEIDLSSYTE